MGYATRFRSHRRKAHWNGLSKKKSGTNYHNYKDFFSLVLLAVCDVHYNFTFVEVGQYGSNNDSGVLKELVFGKGFEQHLFNYPAAKRIPGCRLDKVPYFLVGDEIFPLKDWLMRPYPGKLDEASNIFNYRLSRARRVIENAFGILVARWRIFRGFIRASVENVERYVLAALCLHKYLRQTDNASYGPAGFIDSEDSSGCIKHGEWRSIVTSRDGLVPLPRPHNTMVPNSAKDIREGLKDYLNGVGAVTWQLNHV